MQCASSAYLTCMEVRSASEKTATERRLSSRQDRMMRMAISPLLATNTFLIIQIEFWKSHGFWQLQDVKSHLKSLLVLDNDVNKLEEIFIREVVLPPGSQTNQPKVLFRPGICYLCETNSFEMKKRNSDFNLFMRIIIIVFIAEQILFMGFVLFKKGTSILDYLAGLF